MKCFTQEEKLIAGALLAVAVLMTPVAGVWIWLAISLGTWISLTCLDIVAPATNR